MRKDLKPRRVEQKGVPGGQLVSQPAVLGQAPGGVPSILDAAGASAAAEPRCGVCGHSVLKGKGAALECRRYPPVIYYDPEYDARFPQVQASSPPCGEFKAKEGK
jgi:hypothetical protein